MMLSLADIGNLFVLDRSKPPEIDLALPFDEFFYNMRRIVGRRACFQHVIVAMGEYKAGHPELTGLQLKSLNVYGELCKDGHLLHGIAPRGAERKKDLSEPFYATFDNLYYFYLEASKVWRFDKLQELKDAYPGTKFAIAAYYLIHGDFGYYDEEDIYKNKTLFPDSYGTEAVLWKCKFDYWKYRVAELEYVEKKPKLIWTCHQKIVEEYEKTYLMPIVQNDEEILNYVRWMICISAYTPAAYILGRQSFNGATKLEKYGNELLDSPLDDFSVAGPENLSLSQPRRGRARLAMDVCFKFNRMYRDKGQPEKALEYLERILTGFNGYAESLAESHYALALLKMSGQHPDKKVKRACKEKLFSEYRHTHHKVKMLLWKADEAGMKSDDITLKKNLKEMQDYIDSGKYYPHHEIFDRRINECKKKYSGRL